VPIVRDLGLGDAVLLTELEGGSSGSFRVDLADGEPLVLKTYRDDGTQVPAHEIYAARVLSELDVPITRYLAMDGSKTRLPFAFSVTNYLPGATVGSFKGEADVADLHRQMGALLRQLHAIKLAGYGHFREHGPENAITTHAGWLDHSITDAFRQFRLYGGDEVLAGRLEAILELHRGRVAHGGGPVFAHNDLNPNNVLAVRGDDGRLRLTGLIDFGSAIASDAVSDLAKTIFICEHEAPGSGAAIRDGYGPVDHPDPEAALWIYTLIHRVVMWWWLRRIGVIKDEPSDLIRDLEQMANEGGPSPAS
jgi:aminoglycoside phosphotransferase (APT) family kinase protein